ncbi:hypothetical protein Aca07nite_44050 [Actinoplanes capillaceus]|uniref:Uncharacterized protein n=1 Tax=Actinoplanes campanulatus TaxID=113559 RepID=A0ABQ3WLP0_9ACTN|nr:hypothetical protein GCM10010109_63410 [Actinoplanes campanulatus]GID40792.1 hypothetical protein Aca09nite_72980 [Actinoplanes campanulatus]GID47130.1 hypothetical protein Aca07nite_44050 [Actinoplanes capillaceus]
MQVDSDEVALFGDLIGTHHGALLHVAHGPLIAVTNPVTGITCVHQPSPVTSAARALRLLTHLHNKKLAALIPAGGSKVSRMPG